MKWHGVEVLWVARYDYDAGWVLPPHTHKYYQMIFITSGAGEFTIRERVEDIAPDMLFFAPPQTRHGLQANRDTCIKTLDAKFRIYDGKLRKACEALGPVVHAPLVKDYMRQIREEGERQEAFFREFCHIHLVACLLQLLRQTWHVEANPSEPDFGEAEPPDMVCRSVMKHIKQHYAHDLCIKSLSNSLGFSYRHLSQRFSQAYGVSPIQFLTQYRIEKAKDLIRFSDYDLKRIALLVGFKTVQHFTRVFKQVTDMTPAHWRSLEREGVGKDIYVEQAFTNPNLVIKPGKGDFQNR